MAIKTSSTRRYLQGLKIATSGNAQAFGFSILITVSYGIASVSQGQPSFAEQFGFGMAGVFAFALLNVLVALVGARESDTLGDKRVLLVTTATDFIAVGAGMGAAFGIGAGCSGVLAWVLIPFAAGLVYVLVQGVEFALARVDVDES